MVETLQTDVDQISPKEIPDEYWPRCDWCGDKLDECSAIPARDGNPERYTKTICTECLSVLYAAVDSCVLYSLGESLRELKEYGRSNGRFKHLSSEEITEMARENMKETQTHE